MSSTEKSKTSSAFSGLKRLLTNRRKDHHLNTSTSTPAPATIQLPIITDPERECTMSNKKTSTPGAFPKGKDKAANTNDLDTPPEEAIAWLRECVKVFTTATPVMPVIERLGRALRDNEDLKAQLATREKEAKEKEATLQKTIEAKEAALNEATKTMFGSIWKDFSAKYDAAERLKDKDKELAEKLHEKDQVISQLKANHQSELATQKREREAEVSKIQMDLKRQALRAKVELQDTKKSLEESRELIVKINSDLQDAIKLKDAAEVRERALAKELAVIKEEIGVEDVEDDKFTRGAEELEMKLHTLCKRFFYTPDIAQNPMEPFNETLKRELVASRFLPGSEVERNFPVLLNNTPWSKCLLMALAENIISKQLTAFIFRMGLLPPGTGQHIPEFLDSISCYLMENPRNEARWRSLSCTAMGGDESEHAVIQAILYQLEDIFAPLLDDTRMSEFLENLDSLLREAITFWNAAQHSDRKIIAEFDDPTHPPVEGQCHQEHMQISVSTDQRKEGEVQADLDSVHKPLPLFPRFCIQDEDELRDLYDGRALPLEAPSAIRSRAEMRQNVKSQIERHRASLNGGSIASRPINRRRPSIGTPHANGETCPTGQQKQHSPTSAGRARGPPFGAPDNQRSGPFYAPRPPAKNTGNGGVDLGHGASSMGSGGASNRERTG
ncbi:hypothetical protein K440DRAFT_635437 [Wilcoxina mikolae CBS 423.85]|nr:hypothetical protein K440DRAFT_635437 [Wilcoxina mikolae CBS 423.85]